MRDPLPARGELCFPLTKPSKVFLDTVAGRGEGTADSDPQIPAQS